jgi:hypothetical protein
VILREVKIEYLKVIKKLKVFVFLVVIKVILLIDLKEFLKLCSLPSLVLSNFFYKDIFHDLA